MKSSRSILRRLLRSIGGILHAEWWWGKLTPSPTISNRRSQRRALVALPGALYRARMLNRSCALVLGLLCAFVGAFDSSAFADEGMWLFNAPPLKQLKEKYQFEPTLQWLEHLQKASVRFNSGGSGSFVSANGLVITNHHVGADTLQKMSDPQHNYLKDGFYARTQSDEIKSTDLELNVLMSIEDVTARVNGAVKPSMTSDQASTARNAAIA